MSHDASPQPAVDLSILVSGLERELDPDRFLNLVRREADALQARAEVIPIATRASGFGTALKTALESARGAFIITMDADISPPLTCLADLWACRNDAEVVIASRYVPGTPNRMGTLRAAASALLNVVFRRGLSLSIHDLSSSFRLYRANVIKAMPLHAHDYDVLEEILVRAYAAGWRVHEIPFAYAPNPRVATRAHVMLPPRTSGRSGRCGSCGTRSPPPTTTMGRTTALLPSRNTGSVRATGTSRISSTAKAKCSMSAAVRVTSSARCRRAASRSTSLWTSCGSPDDSPCRSCAPGGYADEHISHYTRRSLLDDFACRGYRHEATRYVLRGELILAFRKPRAADSAQGRSGSPEIGSPISRRRLWG